MVQCFLNFEGSTIHWISNIIQQISQVKRPYMFVETIFHINSIDKGTILLLLPPSLSYLPIHINNNSCALSVQSTSKVSMHILELMVDRLLRSMGLDLIDEIEDEIFLSDKDVPHTPNLATNTQDMAHELSVLDGSNFEALVDDNIFVQP